MLQDAPNDELLAIEDHLQLECTAAWVAAPPLLLLHHNGRGFEVSTHNRHMCMCRAALLAAYASMPR